MLIGSILLITYGISLSYVIKLRKEMINFIETEYSKLIQKTDEPLSDFVDLESYRKINFRNLIPIFNIFYEQANYIHLLSYYEHNKRVLFGRYPEIEKQCALEEEANNHEYKESKDYFIGILDESRPINISFTYDGEKAKILEDSHSEIIKLPENDAYMNLFYLLFCYYYGAEGINTSFNIGEVYNEEMIDNLHNLFEIEFFDDELDEEQERENGLEEMKLIRKR